MAISGRLGGQTRGGAGELVVSRPTRLGGSAAVTVAGWALERRLGVGAFEVPWAGVGVDGTVLDGGPGKLGAVAASPDTGGCAASQRRAATQSPGTRIRPGRRSGRHLRGSCVLQATLTGYGIWPDWPAPGGPRAA